MGKPKSDAKDTMGRLATRSPRLGFRSVFLALAPCFAVYWPLFVCHQRLHVSGDGFRTLGNSILSSIPGGRRPRLDDATLTREQCRAAFPGLTAEIDRVVANGPFLLRKLATKGPLIGRIR